MNLLLGLFLLLQTSVAPTPPQKIAPRPNIDLLVDRNAFTFTEYRLQATLAPEKHGIAVEGDVTLRNDSDKPQNTATLQISSSLTWKAIAVVGAAVKYVDTKVQSDIDHTGAVNEARVTLAAIAPKESVTLHVAYAGTIELSSERLKRIGTPTSLAEQNDWDRIGTDITALRGVGYVAWYPVSIEPALLSDGNTAFERIARWKGRHQTSRMSLGISGAAGVIIASCAEGVSTAYKGCEWNSFGIHVPVLIAGPYKSVKLRSGVLFYLKGSAQTAQRYAAAFDGLAPVIDGPAKYFQKIVQLPASFSAFEAKNFLVTPFSDRTSEAVLRFNLLHTAAHAYFTSERPWLNEGFAHWVQLRAVDGTSGRKAALAMLQERESGLALADSSEHDPQPLTTAYDEIFYRTKAAYVWWMLADMVGDGKLLAAVRAYVPAQDREPGYFQRLVEKESGKGLEQFFDDWVYRDKGLPEFKITDFYPRQNLNGGIMVTVTIENSGSAGAEVPITAHAKNVENSARVWVPAKSKASARIVMPLMPTGVVVNDGSVPEIDPTDNIYTVAPNPSPK